MSPLNHQLWLFLFCALALAPINTFADATAAPSNMSAPATTTSPPTDEPRPNYHLLGWFNTVIPGGGQLLLGNYLRSGLEFTGEVGITGAGFYLSKRSPLTLDGVPEALPQFSAQTTRRGSALSSIDRGVYADLLQEVGIKGHLVDVFDAYREAAKRSGNIDGIDQSSTWEMFLYPFRHANVTNPWFYGAFAAVVGATVIDYVTSLNGGLPNTQRLTPTSNFLYSINYEVWQPIGSGAPEEMFYRGFLQNELYSLVPSPFFAIPITAAAFAFSHAPGPGRISAAAAGAYLGYLAHRYHGNLAPGITLHFWSVVVLGIETVLLNQKAQHTTPPATLAVQINY